MTTNPNAPYFIFAAVKRTYHDLPDLIGLDIWASIQPQVDECLAVLQGEPNDYLSSAQLVGLLAQYENARQRVAKEIKAQEIISLNIVNQMQEIAASLGINSSSLDQYMAGAYACIQWQVDSITIPTTDEDIHLRGVAISEGGIGGASKVRLTKVQLDLGSLSGIVSGLISASVGVIAAPSLPLALPLLIVAGILSVISTLHDTMRIELSEQDASVFWGIICAIGGMHGAGVYESTIIDATNIEREKYGLGILNKAQIQYSLDRLERINTLRKTEGLYYIIERYTIKD